MRDSIHSKTSSMIKSLKCASLLHLSMTEECTHAEKTAASFEDLSRVWKGPRRDSGTRYAVLSSDDSAA